ncbi:type II toxin-antitoxin system MqsA family antitoxin [candidate division KSB1 bacterium]|nr:type II toxin-antitoxin system MqsA family antitoxin [candidate division KSB1 bacterium]
MRCYVCNGEMKKGKGSYNIHRKGYHFILDEIPAWVCENCGETYFEEDEVEEIQSLIDELDSRIKKINKYDLEYV